MKYLPCQNNSLLSSKRCYEQAYVEDHIVKVLCWRCTAEMLPPPPEKKLSTGYPRGWKFMAEFVDKDGNVYHRGELQEELFKTLPPTEIVKDSKPKKKKKSLNDKIMEEVSKRVVKKKSKSRNKEKKR